MVSSLVSVTGLPSSISCVGLVLLKSSGELERTSCTFEFLTLITSHFVVECTNFDVVQQLEPKCTVQIFFGRLGFSDIK